MIKDFVSLFFPNVCLTCGNALGKGLNELCIQCLSQLPKTENHIVEIPEFDQKFSGSIEVAHVLAFLFFQKKGIVQKLLHELKYNDRPDVGELLGRWYGKELKESSFDQSFDLIVPIPLHPKKLKSRGYNQSEHFGRGLSDALEVELAPHALIRVKANETQTNKSRLERWENVEGVFKVKKGGFFPGKRVLVVDDVLTTGSTLSSAMHVILKAGASKVSAAVIASAK